MTDLEAVDALLAAVGPEAELPAPEERVRLRETARLSKAQVARALGVSPTTLGAWEAGREPTGEPRTRYAYLLDGLREKLSPEPAPEPPSRTAPVHDRSADEAAVDDDVTELPAPEPCVLCGHPARHQVAGFAQHLDPEDCAGAPAEPAPATPASAASQATRPAPGPRPAAPGRGGQAGAAAAAAKAPTRRAFQDPAPTPVGLIADAVHRALVQHDGDADAATAELIRTAIPDAMALLDACRKGARYEIVGHPPLPGILRKKTSRGADEIWEARPKWTRAALPPGRHEITALDINGAYLSALKTHLPLGALEHHTGGTHDRRRAGVHLITPPVWEHEDHLPNPLGARDEPGPFWVTEPTLRLLLRLSSPSYGLCEPPVVHESFTSGATENLLEKFRNALRDARAAAVEAEDEVTLEYVKAMYSKFVATMGESNYNRELYRPDWMHLIRSQAFANLWMKAYKAHDEGLTVVRAMGTDELHVIGDWRRVFPEGRGVTEVKVKDVYTAQTGS
ncbi:helix-turn-helix transcriptional regulator [Streptomyces sp. NPDC002992]|uniref:helix-turn-helix domain-containing protein n=1 Tax=Streptomyces sp. NPDC002992 TaxID=3154273 RepID=UPI0033ABC7EA